MANQPSPRLKISEYFASPGDTIVTEAKLLPIKNHLYLVAVTGDNFPPAAALTGAGMAWVLEETVAVNSKSMFLFRGLATSATGLVEESLTVTFAGQDQLNVTIQVVDVNFVDTSGSSGSGAVIQSVPDTTAQAITMAAFGDATNNMLITFALGYDNAGSATGVTDVTPETGYTELDELTSVAPNSTQSTYTTAKGWIGYRIGEDLSFTCTVQGAVTAAAFGIGCEIKMRGATAMLLDLGQPSTQSFAQTITPYKPVSSTPSALGETTRGGVVQRVGEALGLAYDVAGYEQIFLRFLWDKAIQETLLHTRCRITIADMSLTSGTAEYRIPSSVLAIDDGRGSTPAGIGHYVIITLDEMIARQSANPISDTWRKFVCIEGDLLIVSPTPSTSEVLRLYYVAKNAASTADTNDFTSATYGGLPSWASEAVEYYMLWKAAEYDDKYAPLKPTDYMQLWQSECKEIRQKMRRLRDRRNPEQRIGYSRRRQAFAPKNSQYPR